MDVAQLRAEIGDWVAGAGAENTDEVNTLVLRA